MDRALVVGAVPYGEFFERAIRAVRPWGVDVSSGVEERDAEGRPRRGFKDAVRIAAFMQGVRNADD